MKERWKIGECEFLDELDMNEQLPGKIEVKISKTVMA
jgi:hypothetical protein